MATIAIAISEAKKLERGGLYVIEFPTALSKQAIANVRRSIDLICKEYDVQFLILDGGARIIDARLPAGMDEHF